MSEQNEPKVENNFAETLKKIGRNIAFLDGTRTELDRDIKLKSLDLVRQLEEEFDDSQIRVLVKELERTLAQFDATKSELDREAKLEALHLIEELQK